MGKFITSFNDHNAYQQAIFNETNTPNVSLCKSEDEIHYKEKLHDYVEIGGIKWATKNLGAENITDNGLYFQWGDTQGYTAEQIGINKQFDWNNYMYFNGLDEDDHRIFSKYNATDNKLTLDISDDAVNAAWGGNWKMPTIDNFMALSEAADCIFIDNYKNTGVGGYLFTDKIDNTKQLFFPAAGIAYEDQINDSYTYYWTSTSAAECGAEWASAVQFTEDGYDENNNMLMNVSNNPNTRCSGLVIRGILDE